MTSLLLNILYETYSQAPPPSKDFHHFTITKTEIKANRVTCPGSHNYSNDWNDTTCWRLTVGKLHHEEKASEGKAMRLFFGVKQLQKVFGKKVLEYALNLCQGHYDFLVRMPDNLLIHIFSFLDLDDIEQLSKTCKKFQKMCNSEEFWEKIRTLQNKSAFDIKREGLMVYKKLINFHQKTDHQRLPKQRRQTAFF